MLEEKKLYFLDHNNNRINESKLNHATKLLLRQKVLNSSYSYVQEKKSDDVCITKIKQMLEFIKSDNGSGGQSLKQPLAAIPS